MDVNFINPSTECTADYVDYPCAADTTGFVDVLGYGCSDWAGVCTLQVALDYEYTEAQFNDVLANCPLTCCGT